MSERERERERNNERMEEIGSENELDKRGTEGRHSLKSNRKYETLNKSTAWGKE